MAWCRPSQAWSTANTSDVRPIRPDDYCTWRVEADYDPEAKCPWWLQMLDDVFADKTEDERGKTVLRDSGASRRRPD